MKQTTNRKKNLFISLLLHSRMKISGPTPGVGSPYRFLSGIFAYIYSCGFRRPFPSRERIFFRGLFGLDSLLLLDPPGEFLAPLCGFATWRQEFSRRIKRSEEHTSEL